MPRRMCVLGIVLTAGVLSACESAGQPAPANSGSTPRTAAPGTTALTVRAVIEEGPVPQSSGQTNSTATPDGDQLRQNVALVNDPAVRERAFAGLDCSRPDPLAGHEDVNLPLAACDAQGYKYVLGRALLTGKDVADAVATITGPGGTATVDLTLTDAARSTWADFTTRNAGGQAAFVVNATVVTAPTISGPMLDGFIQISGQFDEQGAHDITRQVTGR